MAEDLEFSPTSFIAKVLVAADTSEAASLWRNDAGPGGVSEQLACRRSFQRRVEFSEFQFR